MPTPIWKRCTSNDKVDDQNLFLQLPNPGFCFLTFSFGTVKLQSRTIVIYMNDRGGELIIYKKKKDSNDKTPNLVQNILILLL